MQEGLAPEVQDITTISIPATKLFCPAVILRTKHSIREWKYQPYFFIRNSLGLFRSTGLPGEGLTRRTHRKQPDVEFLISHSLFGNARAKSCQSRTHK